jgi:hypothetical protein
MGKAAFGQMLLYLISLMLKQIIMFNDISRAFFFESCSIKRNNILTMAFSSKRRTQSLRFHRGYIKNRFKEARLGKFTKRQGLLLTGVEKRSHPAPIIAFPISPALADVGAML